MPVKQKTSNKILFLFSFIFLLGIIVRFYKLDNLPMEMYGDIIEGYKFTSEILSGKWPFYFVLGNGPLFFYIVALLSKFFGLFFLTMKYTSVIVGLGIVGTTYLLGKESFNAEIGLLSAFLVAVSRWSIVFSRLGNMPILVPFFTSIIFFLLYMIENNPKLIKNWVFLGFFLGAGFYIYPAFFVTPLAVSLVFILKGKRFLKKNFKKICLTFFVFLLINSYFFINFLKNPRVWLGSTTYYGHKIFVADGKIAPGWPLKFAQNIIKTLLMFHRLGTYGFRDNPAGQPAIDSLSGIFLIVGVLGGVLDQEKRKNTLTFFIIIFTLMLPSILVLNVPSDVPNMSRTIGIFPFIYILIASGIQIAGNFFKKFLSKTYSACIIVSSFILIFALNINSYFKDYAYSLPNHNEGFPRLISEETDMLPDQTEIIMIDSHWAELGQPDWRAVYYEMRRKKSFIYFEKQDFACKSVSSTQPKYFILNPNLDQNIRIVENCLPGGDKQIHYSPKYKFPVFVSYAWGLSD